MAEDVPGDNDVGKAGVEIGLVRRFAGALEGAGQHLHRGRVGSLGLGIGEREPHARLQAEPQIDVDMRAERERIALERFGRDRRRFFRGESEELLALRRLLREP